MQHNDGLMTQEQQTMLMEVIGRSRKSRCVVCDDEFGDDRFIIRRIDVMRNIFGREVPTKVHVWCNKGMDTMDLIRYQEPRRHRQAKKRNIRYR